MYNLQCISLHQSYTAFFFLMRPGIINGLMLIAVVIIHAFSYYTTANGIECASLHYIL